MVESSAALGRVNGRDHHPQAYTMWLAGGGMKPGLTWGETDEMGFHVVKDVADHPGRTQVDAVILGRLLVGVLKHGRPVGDLDQYESLRRPAAQKVLALADRLTKVALVQGFWGKLLRSAVFGVLNLSVGFKRKVQLSLSGLDRREFAELPK